MALVTPLKYPSSVEVTELDVTLEFASVVRARDAVWSGSFSPFLGVNSFMLPSFHIG